MSVVIRLARHGAKKNPFYHIVVTDSREARNSGNILERIGSYDPMAAKGSENRVKFDVEKAKSWLAKGAKPSDRVYKFLANAGILTPKSAPVQTKKNQPSEKTKLKAKDKADKIAKAAEDKAALETAAKDAEAAAKAESSTPAEIEVGANNHSPENPAETATEPVAETPVE